MKKVLPVLFILTMLFAGCSKKNDTPDPSVRIIGKWKAGASTLVYYLAGVEVFRQSIPATATNDYSEFRSSGVLADFTYVSGNNYTETDGSWSITGGTIHLTVQGGVQQDYDFTFIDDNTISLSATATTGTRAYYNTNSVYQYSADKVIFTTQLLRF